MCAYIHFCKKNMRNKNAEKYEERIIILSIITFYRPYLVTFACNDLFFWLARNVLKNGVPIKLL